MHEALARHEAALHIALPGPMSEGNRARLLSDGPAAYRAMLQAIDAARDHVNVESLPVDVEGPGQELVRRLVNKRRQGIKVNLLLDPAQMPGAPRVLDTLRDAGVQVSYGSQPASDAAAVHARPRPLYAARKLLVIDGKVAFIGGACVASASPRQIRAQPWLARQAPCRDIHLRVEGPVVAMLQQGFIDRWVAHTGRRPHLARFFPRQPRLGELRVGLLACQANQQRHSFPAALLRAIQLAQQRICITTACFMPPRQLLHALMLAAERGIAVKLMLPGKRDSWTDRHAGRSQYDKLLKAGVRIYERPGVSLQARTVVIDGLWTTVGCSSLDRRSFAQDPQENLVMLDPQFGAELESVFAAELSHCTEVTLLQRRRRGPWSRLLEALGHSVARFT